MPYAYYGERGNNSEINALTSCFAAGREYRAGFERTSSGGFSRLIGCAVRRRVGPFAADGSLSYAGAAQFSHTAIQPSHALRLLHFVGHNAHFVILDNLYSALIGFDQRQGSEAACGGVVKVVSQ